MVSILFIALIIIAVIIIAIAFQALRDPSGFGFFTNVLRLRLGV